MTHDDFAVIQYETDAALHHTKMGCRAALRFPLMEESHPVNQGDEEDGEDEDDDVHGQAHLDEVGELVSAHALHDEVGLIADGGAEGAGGCETDADNEGHGVGTQLLGHGEGQREGQRGGGVVGDELREDVGDEEQGGQDDIDAPTALADVVGEGDDVAG